MPMALVFTYEYETTVRGRGCFDIPAMAEPVKLV